MNMENAFPHGDETAKGEIAAALPEQPEEAVIASPSAHESASAEPLPLDPTEAESAHALLNRLAQTLAEQNEALEALRALCERYLPGNNSKDEAIARMQKRLDEYERGMLRALKEPLLRDLVLFYDSLDKLLRKCEKGAPGPPEFSRELELLRAELLEIFSTQGMEQIARSNDPGYQPELQKVVQVENAERPEEHQLVIRVVREGFVWEGRVLRKQEVAVKKWTAHSAENGA